MSKKNSSVILKNGFKDYEELSHIYLTFKKKLNFFRKKKFLIAVSGGSDSLALTALAMAYTSENKSKFFYVLVDHKLRKNSSQEAQSVKRLLKKHKVTLYILKNKKMIKKNIQSEARKIRYNLLASFCKNKKINTILTAHNLEDQVETFFIRLSRGSGLDGLSSMKKISKIQGSIKLMRPLLDFKKNKLTRISKVIFGKYYKDPTNKNTKYLRIRIRNLKKTLERTGINYDQVIRSIKNLASSRDTLEQYFEKIYRGIVSKGNKKIMIDLNIFNRINQEMKMRVFKKAINESNKAYYFTRSKKIFNLIDQIQMKKNTKLTLGGCIISREKNRIVLSKEIKN
tara:strand:- start:428 stop:1450 length:1023 start_codon:yes stop_codon:yes gene_type:complete